MSVAHGFVILLTMAPRRPVNTFGTMVVERMTPGPDVESVVIAAAQESHAVILESRSPRHPNGRYSIVAFDPIDIIKLSAANRDWLAILNERIGPAQITTTDHDPPFVGGWMGYLPYEAGAALEIATPSEPAAPHDSMEAEVRFALYDTAAIYDHESPGWLLVGVDVETPWSRSRRSARQRIEDLRRWLNGVFKPDPIDWNQPICDEPAPELSMPSYLQRVDRALEYISAGDVYQVNLTHRFSIECDASPLEVYRRMRVCNRAPLSALLIYPDGAIISASPESFLTLGHRQVVTRPIKGTCVRTGDALLDEARSRALLASEKDRAELIMIIDLLRNDLGKFCEFGTVHVRSSAELEHHPTVSHLVATIEGRPRAGTTWRDALAAAFPGGSITGCPKIRAMQIIRELETGPRGVYCGCIGYIGLDGRMSLNIAIRTMTLMRGVLRLHGGGAIVADSDPRHEYDESLAKVAGLIRSLRACKDESKTIETPGPIPW